MCSKEDILLKIKNTVWYITDTNMEKSYLIFLYFISRFKTERETDEVEMQVGKYNIWMN